MVEYTKEWLSTDQQIERLRQHGLEIAEDEPAEDVLEAIGYYRLTGYLYPFRQSETYRDENERPRIRVLSEFTQRTTLAQAKAIIDFDRRLRMLVLDGLERVEIAVRMRMGYVLGRRSAFGYEDPTLFTSAFTADKTDIRGPKPSKHVQWCRRSGIGRRGPMSSSSSTSGQGMTTGCLSGHSQRSSNSGTFPSSIAG